MTSVFSPKIWTFRLRHFGSSSVCERSDAQEEGLERPEEMLEDGDVERGEAE
jgi:hypothetical protein